MLLGYAVADADPELLILKTSAYKLYCTPISILINSRWLTSLSRNSVRQLIPTSRMAIV